MNSQPSPQHQISSVPLENHSDRVLTNRQESAVDIPRRKIQQRLYSQTEQSLQDALQSKFVIVGIIGLVAIYGILIFIIVALEELQTPEDFAKQQRILSIIELIILAIFVVEIVFNLFAFGVKKYYKDRWLILDSLIILISIIFVVIDMSIEGSISNGVVKVIQAIFRFLRIFLLIRKAQQFKKLSLLSTISTPAEKIIKFLNELKEIIEDQNIKLDIDYCLDKISNNQLYEFGSLGEEDQEIAGWLNQSQKGEQKTEKDADKKVQQISNFVDKEEIQRKLAKLSIPKKFIDTLLEQHDNLYLDPFELDKVCGQQSLVNGLLFFFTFYNLYEVLIIKPKVMRHFATLIQEKYLENPYHNRVHAFDVLQTTNVWMSKCKFIEIGQLDGFDIASVLIAAAIHDVGHFSFTNNFLINTKHELAIRYNDQSVLEMYHPAQAFEIAWSNESANIFDKLSFQQYKKMREQIISMVLATDMAHHASELSFCSGRISANDFEPQGKDKQRLMDLIVHASDISNPIKGFEVYKTWTEKIISEFWNQGDKEKELGLPYSYMANRYTTNIAEAQLGFIDYVIKPTYQCMMGFLPEIEQFFGNLDKNKQKWSELIEYYKQQLAAIQPQ